MGAVGKRTRLSCSAIREGVQFDAPVYFDDGENMFLAAGRPAKKYHVDALTRWQIPYLWTEGVSLAASGEALPAGQAAPAEAPAPTEELLPVDTTLDISGPDELDTFGDLGF